MDTQFSVRPDGIVDATVGSDHSLFNEALADAVSSRAPRGASRQGLSTYWIDVTEERLRQAVEHGSVEPFASGNVTYFRLEGACVVAGYDFDPDEAEADSIALDDFLTLLGEWRLRVIEAGGAFGAEARAGVGGPTPRPAGPAR